MQAHLALEAAVAELAAWRDRPTLTSRLAELESLRDPLSSAANAALQGGLDADAITVVGEGLEKVEAALRARTAAGI